MASQAPALGISIDVLKDLDSESDLQKLISSNSNVLFQLASDLAKFAGQPISAAVGKSAVSLSLTAAPSWKAGPVTFSLTPKASCTITIAAQGEDFETALDITDPTKTSNVQLAAQAGMTYINIDIDFSIAGSVGGSGTAYGISISGKAAGSLATTLSFCQPVPSTTETLTALKNAFSDIVFPTSPDAALSRMIACSSTRMTFDGTLSLELDVSYGLADYKLSAPSLGLLQQSFKSASENLKLPTAEIKAGATATIKYSHTDHFGLIVERKDANTALVYLVRAAVDASSANLGITVGITTTPVSVTIDPTQLQQTVQTITGSSTLATNVGNAVTPKINDLQSAALAKLNTWIKDLDGNAGLSVALDKQTGRTALFSYSVDLSRPTVSTLSWNNLITSNVADATDISGFALLPGSGVQDQLKKSTTLQFQFFNLFKYTNVTDFFSKCTTELMADGAIRILCDIGEENLVTTNSSSSTVRVHFSGAATADTKGNISQAAVDLNFEMYEKNNSKTAALLIGILGVVDQTLLQPTMNQMTAYIKSSPTGTLGLVAVMHSSAFQRLKYSPFSGGIGGTPKVGQTLDGKNWDAIHAATVTLMGKDRPFITPYTFHDWGEYNSYCNTTEPDSPANRREKGPTNNVPSTFYKSGDSNMVNYFLDATAGGMNLFEDLVTLGNDLAATTTAKQWNIIQADMAPIVTDDINMDYAESIAAAVYYQAANDDAAQMSVSTAQDSNSFTTTLTIG